MDKKKSINTYIIVFLTEIGILLGMIIVGGAFYSNDTNIMYLIIIETIGTLSAVKGLSNTLKEHSEMVKNGTWK